MSDSVLCPCVAHGYRVQNTALPCMSFNKGTFSIAPGLITIVVLGTRGESGKGGGNALILACEEESDNVGILKHDLVEQGVQEPRRGCARVTTHVSHEVSGCSAGGGREEGNVAQKNSGQAKHAAITKGVWAVQTARVCAPRRAKAGPRPLAAGGSHILACWRAQP